LLTMARQQSNQLEARQWLTLSRHGYQMLPHGELAAEAQLPPALIAQLQQQPKVLSWWRTLRHWWQQQGGSPAAARAMTDSLRTHTNALWQALSSTEKRRFMRHAAPYWFAMRHRVPAPLHAELNALRDAQQLHTIAARIVDIRAHATGLAVTLRPRGSK